MRKQRYGNVVLMGSDQVFIGKGNSAVYGMSKAAVGQLTKRRDRLRDGASGINCICGHDRHADDRAASRFHQASGLSLDAIYEMLRTAQPIQRLGTPDEIARAVLFLLSDDCTFMTGAWQLAPTVDIPVSNRG